jgi:hypothetical protein
VSGAAKPIWTFCGDADAASAYGALAKVEHATSAADTYEVATFIVSGILFGLIVCRSVMFFVGLIGAVQARRAQIYGAEDRRVLREIISGDAEIRIVARRSSGRRVMRL